MDTKLIPNQWMIYVRGELYVQDILKEWTSDDNAILTFDTTSKEWEYGGLLEDTGDSIGYLTKFAKDNNLVPTVLVDTLFDFTRCVSEIKQVDIQASIYNLPGDNPITSHRTILLYLAMDSTVYLYPIYFSNGSDDNTNALANINPDEMFSND